MASTISTGVDKTHVDPAKAKSFFTIAAAVFGLGLLLAIAGFASDQARFSFSYLTGFYFVTTMGLGGLFFVLVQYLTRAGWSVAPRRLAEWLSGILPISALLFIPIAALSSTIWHGWMSPDKSDVEGYAIIVGKQAYLNPTFFFIRCVIYFAIWAGTSYFFRTQSLKQDETGDVSITSRLEGLSAPATPLFALSLSFAGFDWIMSLNPHWFSTIFGVYIFAGCAMSCMAFLAILTTWLQTSGHLSQISNVEHRHDIGKLFFGFVVFWAYIGFCQFFLIWYANMPEETSFFYLRWYEFSGSWSGVTTLLIFGHFLTPFILLLSRHMKRHPVVLPAVASWMLLMHYVDLYWLVMPNYTASHHMIAGQMVHGGAFSPSWIDLGGLLLPVGALLLWIASRMKKEPIYPLKDPRIAEAMKVQNL